MYFSCCTALDGCDLNCLSSRWKSCRLAGESVKITSIHLCQILKLTVSCWICDSHPAGRQIGGGALLEIFASLDVASPLKGHWAMKDSHFTDIYHHYFWNHFSFIRRFEVVSDGIERRPGAHFHKGHTTDSSPWCRLPWWLLSTQHLSLRALIHVPCTNGHINKYSHVQCVSWNPYQDLLEMEGKSIKSL